MNTQQLGVIEEQAVTAPIEELRRLIAMLIEAVRDDKTALAHAAQAVAERDEEMGRDWHDDPIFGFDAFDAEILAELDTSGGIDLIPDDNGDGHHGK